MIAPTDHVMQSYGGLLRNLPAPWRYVRLKRLLRRNDGGAWGDDPTGYLDTIVLRSTEQTVDGRWLIADPALRHLSEADAEATRLVAGDLLVTKSSGSSLHIGKTTLVDENVEAMRCGYSNFMQRLRLGSALLPRFAWYYLNSEIARTQLGLISTTSTGLANLSGSTIGELMVPVAPAEYQAALVRFLDAETGRIDALIAEQARLIALLNARTSSLVLASFADPDARSVRLGEAAILVPRPVHQKPGEEYTRLGLYNRGRGIFHKDASEMDDMGESDFFWVEEGDLIISGQFAWEGAVALAGPREAGCVVSHRYPVLRGNTDMANTEYVYALLCTRHGDFFLNEHSRGAAGRNRPLNIHSLLKEQIPLPSMAKQRAIAVAIHKRSELLAQIVASQRLLLERRAALITAAVTGQIDVRGLAETAA